MANIESEMIPLDLVRNCFLVKRPPEWLWGPPPDWLLADTAYLIRLARTQPRSFIYGSDRAELAGAVRVIFKCLPGLIETAEIEAAEAKAVGRATDMDQFALRGKALLEAAEPFRPITKRINPRGDWHGWARMFALDVRYIAQRMQPRLGFIPDHPSNHKRVRISFAKPTSPGIQIVRNLLGVAGFKDLNEVAIVEVLRARPAKGG